jgi:hypothetical protein
MTVATQPLHVAQHARVNSGVLHRTCMLPLKLCTYEVCTLVLLKQAPLENTYTYAYEDFEYKICSMQHTSILCAVTSAPSPLMSHGA